MGARLDHHLGLFLPLRSVRPRVDTHLADDSPLHLLSFFSLWQAASLICSLTPLTLECNGVTAVCTDVGRPSFSYDYNHLVGSNDQVSTSAKVKVLVRS